MWESSGRLKVARVTTISYKNAARRSQTVATQKELLDFARQLGSGAYPRRTAAAGALAVARAPRAALAVAQHVRRLDLRRECARVRAAGIPATVIGCISDTLVTTDRARALADLLGARYEELDLRGGHMWMLADGARFAAVVARS